MPMAVMPGSTEAQRLLSPDMNIKPNTPLSAYTTFQLGGPCHCLIECTTPDELIQTVQKFKKENTPFLLIGGGSNLVISDHGLNTTVIRFLSPTPLIERNGNEITVSASTLLDDLALFCVDQGLSGLNYTTGIPGTVGGAVVGNAGAWGKQVGDVLKSAEVLDNKGRLTSYSRLDVSLKKTFTLGKYSKLEATVSLTNALNQQNIFYFDRISYTQVNQLPILPSAGVSVSF